MYQIKDANIFITVMMVPVPMMVEPIQWKSRRLSQATSVRTPRYQAPVYQVCLLIVCYVVCLFVCWFDGYSLKTRDIFSHEIKKGNFIFHLWIVYFVFCICVFWFILFYVLVRKYFLNLYICLESFFLMKLRKWISFSPLDRCRGPI